MALNTIRDLLEDVKATLGLGIDDAEWDDGSIIYNIGVAYDKIKGQDLKRGSRSGESASDMTDVSTFLVPLLTDTTYNRRYFQMPGPAFDVPVNGGIEYLAYYRPDIPPNCPPEVARVQYQATTWRELALLYADPLQKPSPERPRFIRAPNQTWVFGQSPQVTQVELGLYLSFSPLDSIDLDAQLNLPVHRVFDLRRMVLAQGNWLMLQPQERLLNDGRANNIGEPVRPSPPQISVKDPILTQQPD